MRLLRLAKNVSIGINNIIQSGVVIHPGVTIGNNNKIYDGTIIYPNTTIGNNNVILNDNILGEHPIEASEIFTEKKFNGLEIGDDNFFHVKNLVFTGSRGKTKIGDNNKLLAENHIGHDTHITSDVVIYPRCITGGLSTLLPYSTMGMYSTIQQNSVMGRYSMLGMGNISSHNIFPFYIFAGNKYLRPNHYKIPEELKVQQYEHHLKDLIQKLKEDFDREIVISNPFLPEAIKTILIEFIDNCKNTKI